MSSRRRRGSASSIGAVIGQRKGGRSKAARSAKSAPNFSGHHSSDDDDVPSSVPMSHSVATDDGTERSHTHHQPPTSTSTDASAAAALTPRQDSRTVLSASKSKPQPQVDKWESLVEGELDNVPPPPPRIVSAAASAPPPPPPPEDGEPSSAAPFHASISGQPRLDGGEAVKRRSYSNSSFHSSDDAITTPVREERKRNRRNWIPIRSSSGAGGASYPTRAASAAAGAGPKANEDDGAATVQSESSRRYPPLENENVVNFTSTSKSPLRLVSVALGSSGHQSGNESSPSSESRHKQRGGGEEATQKAATVARRDIHGATAAVATPSSTGADYDAPPIDPYSKDHTDHLDATKQPPQSRNPSCSHIFSKRSFWIWCIQSISIMALLTLLLLSLFGSLTGNAASRIERMTRHFKQSTSNRASDVASDAAVANLEHNMANVQEPLSHGDVPFFWLIPRSGDVVERVMSKCLKLVSAARHGEQEAVVVGEGEEVPAPLLRIIEVDGSKYVNVDTTTPQGLDEARILNLAQSGLADVIISSYLPRASFALFSPQHRGQCFTMIRHPVDRAVAIYNVRTLIGTPQYDPNLAVLTLEEYANSPLTSADWMTRFLTNSMVGPLTDRHLNDAKEILRRKCLVGLHDRMEESFQRFERYYNWNSGGTPWWEGGVSRCHLACMELEHGKETVKEHNAMAASGVVGGTATTTESEDLPAAAASVATVRRGDAVWEALMRRNLFDVKLYEFARELFEEQKYMYHSKTAVRKWNN